MVGPGLIHAEEDERKRRLEAAATAATTAEATGQNARSMVLSDRAKLAALQATADQANVSMAQAEAAHAALQAQITALQNRTANLADIQSEIITLNARVAALEALKVTVGIGQVTLSGTLLAGNTQTVLVPLNRNMGSATYSAGYSMTGGAGLLGSLTIDGITAQTSSSATLRIRNTSLLGLTLSAATVTVIAAREG